MLVEINQENFRLSQCEQVIEKSLKAVFEMGKALMEIRDERLYKHTHSTFDEYCDTQWGISRQRAHQLISHFNVKENLSTVVDILPKNETQTRPLNPFPPNEQQAIWMLVVEKHGEYITEDFVKQEVLEYKASKGIQNEENGSIEYRVVTYLNPSYKKKFDDVVEHRCGDTEAAVARSFLKEGIDREYKQRISIAI